jgi:hypothetical protein
MQFIPPAIVQSAPTGTSETEELPRRRPAPSLAALPAEEVRGRILNSGQAAQYWGVSVAHWRRLYRSGKVPAPISIGLRKKGWRLNVLSAALDERGHDP